MPAELGPIPFDVILGTDVAYHEHLYQPLIQVKIVLCFGPGWWFMCSPAYGCYSTFAWFVSLVRTSAYPASVGKSRSLKYYVFFFRT